MKTAVISVDIINEICDPQGSIVGFSERIKDNHIIDNVNQVLSWGRAHEYPCLHLRLAFRRQYSDCSSVSPIFRSAREFGLLQRQGWGCEFSKGLQIADDDIDIIKHRVSGFYGTDLELILRSNNIEHIVILGVATDNAVEMLAREAHDRDFHVTVVSDACETSSDELQINSLKFMSQFADISGSDSPHTHNPNWQSQFL